MALVEDILGSHEGGLELRCTWDTATGIVSSFSYQNPTNRRAQLDLYDPETSSLLASIPLPGSVPALTVAALPSGVKPLRFAVSMSFGYGGTAQTRPIRR